MPTNTGVPWELPYPLIGEQADVPADMGELADAVAERLSEIDGYAGTRHPWRMAAGRTLISGAVATGASYAQAVTFPVDRFSVPPIVTANIATSSSMHAAVSVSVATTAGFTFRYHNVAGGIPASPGCVWHAVQMTPADAAG